MNLKDFFDIVCNHDENGKCRVEQEGGVHCCSLCQLSAEDKAKCKPCINKESEYKGELGYRLCKYFICQNAVNWVFKQNNKELEDMLAHLFLEQRRC